MIENWVEDEPENEEFFYACLHEWEMTHPQYNADTKAAITKFNESILEQPRLYIKPGTEQRHTEHAKKNSGWQKYLVAASVLFVLLLGTWLFRDIALNKSYTTGNGEISAVTLSDGSKVVLNSNSLLQVPRFGFGGVSRQVQLRGEAMFSVVHTLDDKKFVVLTDPGFQVEVLGTEFNLSARDSDTKVVLQEGKVKVLYKEEPEQAATSLIMAPGDLVTVDEKQKKLQVKQVRHPENYSAWQHGRFVFDRTSLAEIKEILQDNYGLVVSLRGIDGSKISISGSFKARNADELLLALSEILDISVIRQDNRVMLISSK
ncbi:FecR family protein [Pontibacter toksunensis]|uniref:FecR family protein n=2 Tax=Pontibacter toksunensis TaxID=1332631 RepID=A0ABW6BXM8_9BACT